MCDRTVCDKEPKFRIFNDNTVEGRKYCEDCWRLILLYNPVLKWEKIEDCK